jgi:hypothetical protein
MRQAELAAIGLALVCAGAVLVAPDLAVETRAAALSAIAGGLVLLSRLPGRRRP